MPGPVHLGLLKVEDVRLARLNDAFGRLVGVWTDRCLDPATDQIVVSTIDRFLCLFLLLWAIIEGLACVDAIVVADRPRLAQVSLRIRFLEGATSVRLSDRCFSTNFLICIRVAATLFFIIDGNIRVRSYFLEHVNLLRVCLCKLILVSLLLWFEREVGASFDSAKIFDLFRFISVCRSSITLCVKLIG